MCLAHFNLYGKDSDSVPFMKCDFSRNNLWAENNKMRKASGSWEYSDRMFRCEDHKYTHITKISFKMCDHVHSGTDSSIQLQIFSGRGSCTTKLLDSSRDDFERGNYNEFEMNHQDECGNMKIEDGKVTVNVMNLGSDALCLSQVYI